MSFTIRSQGGRSTFPECIFPTTCAPFPVIISCYLFPAMHWRDPALRCGAWSQDTFPWSSLVGLFTRIAPRLLWYSRTVFQPNVKIYSGIARWHSLGALAAHGVCADDALELYIDCCIPLAQRQAMFDRLDDIHLQALSNSRDLILRINLWMKWGVSAVLLPGLHCSHFMGSIILLMTCL